MIYKINKLEHIDTKEVSGEIIYKVSVLKGLSKDNVLLKIHIEGDLPHHVIEGAVDLLKKIDPLNPHLK